MAVGARMTPWILGLTGGIGSGKSAVADRFAALGVHVVDSDQVSRHVVANGQPALLRIAEHFGSEVLLPDGELNRGALRRRVFEDPAERQWLEALLHPLVAAETDRRLLESDSLCPYTIMLSPLLIESGRYRKVHRLLVVDVPEDIQLQRTVRRDAVDERQVRAVLKVQLDRSTRLRYANDVLLNVQDFCWLDQEVSRLHRFYLTLQEGREA